MMPENSYILDNTEIVDDLAPKPIWVKSVISKVRGPELGEF